MKIFHNLHNLNRENEVGLTSQSLFSSLNFLLKGNEVLEGKVKREAKFVSITLSFDTFIT